MSRVTQTEAPAGEPVTLAEAKAWLRVDGSDEDGLILSLITAARGYVEDYTRRALITQEFELAMDVWPGSGFEHSIESRVGSAACREIEIPMAPLRSIESVKYYDADGTLQTLATSKYHVDTRSEPGRVVLAEDEDWPELDARPNAVVIAFTAGFGTPSEVPAGIRTAVRYMVSHWFENRAHVNIGNIVNEIPQTASALLNMNRLPGAA